jgi:hypothetical protein
MACLESNEIGKSCLQVLSTALSCPRYLCRRSCATCLRSGPVRAGMHENLLWQPNIRDNVHAGGGRKFCQVTTVFQVHRC